MQSGIAKSFAVAVAWLTAMAAVASAQTVNHPAGFTGQTDLTLSQNASLSGSNVRLTPAGGTQTGYCFTNVQVPVNNFQTTFTFHILNGTAGFADGMGFCIQRVGAAPPLTGQGGGMGYAGMATSVFVKFDVYPAVSTTQIYINGAAPADAGSINVAPTLDFHSQHDFRCDMTYNGTTLSVTITDTSNSATLTQNYPIDIPTTIGGATAFVGFSAATGGENAIHEVVNWTYANLPAPTGLTATNGINQVGLSWTAAAGATGYTILRSATSGGPYTSIGTTAGTTFTDNTAAYPNTYYYVVQSTSGTLTSNYSNQATGIPLPPPVSVSPTGPITTSETGTTATLRLTLNISPSAAATIQINSSVPTQAVVSGQGNGDATLQGPAGSITIHINAGTPVGTFFDITVTGVRDFIDNGDQAYVISFVVAGGGGTWGVTSIPSVNGTNLDIDTVGLLVTPTGGLQTTTAGGAATFTVQLNSRPQTPVTITISSSNITEGTVAPTTLMFDGTTWDTPQTVTVTGQGINISYVNTVYSIDVSVDPGSDAGYLGRTATVSVTNIHLEVPPALPIVWGGGGSGGCGLLGAEIALAMGLAAVWRRRRRHR